MDYFSIGYNACCLTLQSFMQLIFAGRFTGKTLKIWHFGVYLALLVMLSGLAERLAWPPALAIAVQVLVLYALNRLALGNRPAAAAAAAMLAVYIAQLSFGLVNSAESLFFWRFLGRPLLYLLLILATAAALLICAVCYMAVRRFLSLPEDAQTPYISLLLPPGLFCFMTELYILDTAYGNVTDASAAAEPAGHIALLLIQTTGLAAMFCALYAYRRIYQGFLAQAEMRTLRQAAQAQKTYIDEARLRYEQTKDFRHDLQNHLTVLNGLLRRNEPEAARAYLQKLTAAARELSFPYQTGSPVLDILLSEKLGLARAEGVRTEADLLLPAGCGVDDFDLCVIFANALDNAVNACREYSVQGAKSITVSGRRQGDFYLLEFTNTCAGAKEHIQPGVGLNNIRLAAEKYRGALDWAQEEQEFRLSVLLNIAPD